MSNEENNLGMAGETGVNEAPMGGMGGRNTPGFQSAGTAAETSESPEGTPGDPDLMGDFSPNRFAELEAKAAKADENWEKYVRAVADLDNYKKRALRERQDATKYANEALLEKLLPIVDNFEAALAAANAANAAQGTQGGNVESLKMGINMIHSQLKSFLADAGVEEIDALNKPFDPNLHEAVSQQAAADVPEGQVLQQMRKGYRYRDRLIRPAMVVVAKKP
jgi:molecular chaperone GrpE